MASTYTDIGTELMVTGENAGNWGTKTNTNIQILEEAVRGYVAQSIAGGADTTALTYTDGSTGDVARNMVIALTGSITGNQVVTVTAKEKLWIVDNQTSGAYTVQFMVSGQTGVTWAATDKGTKILYCNGTDVIDSDIGGVGSYDLNGEELILDADADTSFTADTDDQIDIKIGGTDQLTIKDGALSPVTTNDIDLGTASLEFKNAYFDGTVTSDAFAGPLTGNVTGNASGTAATVTTAAQTNITSLGTLTTLTVDNVITNGATIGHTSDTDLITLADGIVTVAGEISVTTLDIGGTNVTSDATELNLLDGKDATNLALTGIQGGTNFTSSLLIGHATTGTLDAANYNTIIGDAAGNEITSGDNNTLVGFNSGTELKAGSNNIGVGGYTFSALTTQGNNTAVGYLAQKDATGSSNTSLGYDSLEDVTGTGNIGVGYGAGNNITSGSGNVVIGNADVSSATGDDQLSISDGEDGAVVWMTGDSSANLTTTGDVTLANDKKVIFGDAGENIVGDGTLLTIASSQNLVLDAANDLKIDAGNGNIYIQDDGTIYGHIVKSGDNDFQIKSYVSDKDFKILGNDGGAQITALAFDMSEAGAATFNAGITVGGASQLNGAVTVGVDDTGLDVKLFGASAGAYMEWDESIDTLRIMGASADAVTSTGKLLLATSLTDINASDVIGKIDFQAPHEAGGTDAITVAASIQAMAQGTFSASVNATDLIFFTGHSEAATEKFRFTSQGEIGVGGANYGTDGQVLTSAGAGAAPAWEDAAGGLTGKVEGTNFVDSLLVGHATTGTLSTASFNTGVGIDAMDAITSGDYNTFLGFAAGTALTGSGQNTAVGANAMVTAPGSYNTALGATAGYAITSTGHYNTLLGRGAGSNITSGDANVIIGAVDAASATGNHQLKITGYDGSTTVNWITGDSSGNVITQGTTHAAGGQLTTTGKSLVMGF